MKTNVLITGSNGLLANNLKIIIKEESLENKYKFFFHNREMFDLKDFDKLNDFIKDNNINEIIHTAARVGGIFDNLSFPYDYAYQNLVMDQNIIKCAIELNINNLIVFGSTCMYPDKLSNDSYPLTEEMIYSGEPTQSNFSYANSKRTLISSIDAAFSQYGLNYTALIPTNLYGYFDHYYFKNNKFSTHFVASAISKILYAKNNSLAEVEFFGTGTPLRQYLFSKDLAKIVLDMLQMEPLNDYYNVSNDENLEIKKLAFEIAEVFEYEGDIKFDNEAKFDGQYRKDVSSKKLNNILKIEFTDFNKGLKFTKKWLETNVELDINTRHN